MSSASEYTFDSIVVPAITHSKQILNEDCVLADLSPFHSMSSAKDPEAKKFATLHWSSLLLFFLLPFPSPPLSGSSFTA